jgi:hypothetical protein
MHDTNTGSERKIFRLIYLFMKITQVNLRFCLSLKGFQVILSNGHEVEVARRKKGLLIAKMKEYYKF